MEDIGVERGAVACGLRHLPVDAVVGVAGHRVGERPPQHQGQHDRGRDQAGKPRVAAHQAQVEQASRGVEARCGRIEGRGQRRSSSGGAASQTPVDPAASCVAEVSAPHSAAGWCGGQDAEALGCAATTVTGPRVNSSAPSGRRTKVASQRSHSGGGRLRRSAISSGPPGKHLAMRRPRALGPVQHRALAGRGVLRVGHVARPPSRARRTRGAGPRAPPRPSSGSVWSVKYCHGVRRRPLLAHEQHRRERPRSAAARPRTPAGRARATAREPVARRPGCRPGRGSAA